MENIELFVTGNTDVSNDNLKAIFRREFSEPVAEICKEAIVLIFQRDQKPRNRYKAKIYCDNKDKYREIHQLLIQSNWDIEVEPYYY